jgi:N-acyl-D-aspartate/D-glutamate deacylase
MGERAVNHAASTAEIEAMQALLRVSIREGGLGFSTTLSQTHNDAAGEPVPSRAATDEELYALADVVSEFPGTAIMMIPGVDAFSQEMVERMTNLSLRSKRPLNWNLLNPVASQREMVEGQLAASDYAAERGATVLALTVPQAIEIRINFLGGFVLDALPGWDAVLGLPLEERKQALSDPTTRKWMDEAAHSEAAGALAAFTDWESMTIVELHRQEHQPLVGMTVAELAAQQGKQPFDALLDLAVADDLKTYFKPPSVGSDDESWQMRGQAWVDDRTIVGASDAGAHLDMIDTFAFSTQILGEGRRRTSITTEQVVHQLTEVPARLFGLRERGLIAEGYHADIVVFDEETVEKGPTYVRYDLPCGSPRLFADAVGIDHVFVNGREIVRGTNLTGKFPGQILRPGIDTDTVRIPADA